MSQSAPLCVKTFIIFLKNIFGLSCNIAVLYIFITGKIEKIVKKNCLQETFCINSEKTQARSDNINAWLIIISTDDIRWEQMWSWVFMNSMKLVISLHLIDLVHSHQRWKQTRNRVYFHLWCDLTLALWCHSIVWKWVTRKIWDMSRNWSRGEGPSLFL